MMRVELTAAALRSAHCEDVVLLGIFATGILGRHRVFVENPDDLNQWHPCAVLGSLLREEIEEALRVSEQAEALGPPQIHRIIVDDVQEDSWTQEWRLSPRSALSLLGRPLRILLENGRNDRDFILSFCTVAQREALERFARQGWLDFSTGGGISSLSAILDEEEDALAPLLRTFVLADSDALYPGAPSLQAQGVQERIDRHAARLQLSAQDFGHILSARNAESYADPVELRRWAGSRLQPAERNSLFEQSRTPRGQTALLNHLGAPGSERRLLLTAIVWGQLTVDQRRHLDAKNGLGGQNDPRLCQSLSPFQRAVLQSGFGTSLSRRFYSQSTRAAEPTGELQAVISRIFGRL